MSDYRERHDFLLREARQNAEERKAERKLGLKVIEASYKEMITRFPEFGPTRRTLDAIRKQLRKIA